MSAAYSVRGTHEDAAKGTRCLPVAAVAMAAAAWAMVVLDRKREEIKVRAKNRRYLHPRAAWEHRSKNNNNNNNNDGNNNNNNTTPHNEIALRRGKHNTETATKHVLHV